MVFLCYDGGMRELYVIAHDMRSTHNVGSLLRTCEGLGVKKVFLTGYTPYPIRPTDPRLPHIREKLHAQIQKTALGAESLQSWEYHEDIHQVLSALRQENIPVIALEQTTDAVPLPDYNPPDHVAILLGTEVTGLPPELLQQVTTHIVIPMYGKKESFNVVQAAAMTLYALRFR